MKMYDFAYGLCDVLAGADTARASDVRFILFSVLFCAVIIGLLGTCVYLARKYKDR